MKLSSPIDVKFAFCPQFHQFYLQSHSVVQTRSIQFCKMNSRKINFNRNKKRIGNLITGILHQFGESTVQNLTKNVSIRSNQSMDYIGSAVRRSLRCGARTGFIVQTGQKTFKLPFQCYETDGKIKYNSAEYEECYKRQHQKEKSSGITTRECPGINMIDHKKCTSPVIRHPDANYCNFHLNVIKYLKYMKHFVDKFYEDGIIKNEILKSEKSKAFWDHLYKIERKKTVVYQERLATFLRNYKNFILGRHKNFWMENFPPNHEEKQDEEKQDKKLHKSPAKEKCAGINIKDGKECSNEADTSWPGEQHDLCTEHQYISVILKVFGRSPVNGNENNQIDFSAFAKNVVKQIYTIYNYGQNDKINLLNFCVMNHVIIVFRYLNHWINKSPYLEIYGKGLATSIKKINQFGITWQKSACQCIPKEDIDKMFSKFTVVQFEGEAEIAKDKNVNDRKRKNQPNSRQSGESSPKPKKKDQSGSWRTSKKW
ncbi:hypothetical protein HA402_003161 [Bradysia odoriphaga]|nr:hypothetical protein HA402_003161 [Bradysia odoriphaga]